MTPGTEPDTEPSTDLILVRHGETAWNRERRIQGQLDTPLNDEGQRQAEAAARRLAADRPRFRLDEPGREVLIVSSDLLRCRQTADPIASAMRLPVSQDARLRERHYGRFQTHTYAEVQRDMAADWARWLSGDPDFNVDGGESLRTFAARVEEVLVELATRHAGATLVVVTHGGVLDIAYRLCQRLPLTAPRDFPLLNASLNRIRWDGTRFEVIDWGEVSHWQPALDEVEPGETVQSSSKA